MTRCALIYFTHHGKKVAEKIITEYKQDIDFIIYEKDKISLDEFVSKEFATSEIMIFIGASGIAVRKLAPHIKSKAKDPAVIVIDDGGNFVISLLSGHLGGANQWTKDLATSLGATPVITTSTDVNQVFAIDNWCKENQCQIEDLSKIKKISAALIAGEKVGFISDFPVEGQLPSGLVSCDSTKGTEDMELGIVVSYKIDSPAFAETFKAIPKQIVLGVGCRKNIESQVFEEVILQQLKENNIDINSVATMHSIDLKQEEKCILDFSEKYNIPFSTYSANELKEVEGSFTPSKFVAGVTGVDNVCERSAIKGSNGQLISKKIGCCGVTVAIAVKDWKCKF